VTWPSHLRRQQDAAWRRACGLSAAIALAIIGLSLAPGAGAPSDDGMLDKLLHAVAYALLVLPLVLARPGVAVVAVVLATGMGGVVELIQPHVGRSGEWQDALANLVGATAGAGLAFGLRRIAAGRGPCR
jgi:VanZ family protein